MGPADGLPFGIDPDWLASCRFVADLIYSPPARRCWSRRGPDVVATANGLGMLIHQAARQIEMWTGRPAPLEAMSAAALAALARPTG